MSEHFVKAFGAACALLAQHNPIPQFPLRSQEEYFPEALAILPRLPDCNSEADVATVAYEVFRQKLGFYYELYGNPPIEYYRKAAQSLWKFWLELPEEQRKAVLERRVPTSGKA